MTRKFPRFQEGDHDKWSAVMKRARDGSDMALSLVDWSDPTERHQVAREILREVRSGRKTGSDLRRTLRGAPYGWPQDAIDAMLVVLVQGGHLRAEKDGNAISTSALDATVIAKAAFVSEAVVLTATDKIALRNLYQELNLRCKTGEEASTAPQFIDAWRALANNAGGSAPLPEVPSLVRINGIASRSGNDQLAALAAEKSEIAAEIGAWKSLADRRPSRTAGWDLAQRLLGHARDLPGAAEAGTEIEAIRTQRSLLAETDPIAPIRRRLAEVTRSALGDRHRALTNAIVAAQTSLDGDPTWSALESDERRAILDRVSLAVPTPLSVSGEDDLASALDRRALEAWDAEIAAVEQRRLDALAAAAEARRKADPTVVTTTVAIDRGTLPDEAAVLAWIETQRRKLLGAVKTGPVIVR